MSSYDPPRRGESHRTERRWERTTAPWWKPWKRWVSFEVVRTHSGYGRDNVRFHWMRSDDD
jgi:hypothetical protein